MTPTDPPVLESDDSAAPFAFAWIVASLAWIIAILAWIFWYRGYA